MPSYSNGSALPFLGGSVLTISSAGGQQIIVVQTVPTILQFDKQGTTDVLTGYAANAIDQNPEKIQTATAKNLQASRGRRESAAAFVGAPGLITSKLHGFRAIHGWPSVPGEKGRRGWS